MIVSLGRGPFLVPITIPAQSSWVFVTSSC